MNRRGGLAAGKAMMKMIGCDCGPVRAPLQNPSSEAVESLTRELKAAGFPLSANSLSPELKTTPANVTVK
jgi:dihydrodipicolinate synthase/N-acetylneuraminate lyase